MPFKICEQPFVLPRPILTDLGITYRRVPVLSIGKDVFCDNTCFIDALQTLLGKSGGGLKASPADRAYEAWGYRSFWVALPCVPASLITEPMAKDRENLFGEFPCGGGAGLGKDRFRVGLQGWADGAFSCLRSQRLPDAAPERTLGATVHDAYGGDRVSLWQRPLYWWKRGVHSRGYPRQLDDQVGVAHH